MYIRVFKLALSSSTLARYLLLPVSRRIFFAMRVMRTAVLVSVSTIGTSTRYIEQALQIHLVFVRRGQGKRRLYIIWIHCIHLHSSRGFISTQPATTGPRPVPPRAATANNDIGRPRLLSQELKWIKYTSHVMASLLFGRPDISNCPSNHGSPCWSKGSLYKARNNDGLYIFRSGVNDHMIRKSGQGKE